MSVTPRKIPVFVFPSNLKFYLSSKSSHKQLLTIYNPYEFAVRFRVLCTAPTKYTVIDPDGSIGPQALVDIVIRHTMPTPGNCGVVDKFRITMLDQQTQQIMGRRVVDAILLDCDKESTSDDGDYHMSYRADLPTNKTNSSVVTPSSLYLILVIGLIAILILCFPTSLESVEPPNPSIPVYLHMSIQIKLFCAFIVGMITLVLIKVV